MNNEWLAGLYLLQIMLVVNFIRYREHQFFNFTDAKFRYHYLIAKYKIDQKQDEINESRLNLAVFLSVVAALLFAALVFAMTEWDIILSAGTYIILKDVFRRIVFWRVGLKYGAGSVGASK